LCFILEFWSRVDLEKTNFDCVFARQIKFIVIIVVKWFEKK